ERELVARVIVLDLEHERGIGVELRLPEVGGREVDVPALGRERRVAGVGDAEDIAEREYAALPELLELVDFIARHRQREGPIGSLHPTRVEWRRLAGAAAPEPRDDREKNGSDGTERRHERLREEERSDLPRAT